MFIIRSKTTMSKRVGVKLTESDYKKFRIYLAKNNKTGQEVLETLVKKLLKENNEQ